MFACFVSFTRHYKAGHLCFPLWFVGTFVHISGSASAAKATPFFIFSCLFTFWYLLITGSTWTPSYISGRLQLSCISSCCPSSTSCRTTWPSGQHTGYHIYQRARGDTLNYSFFSSNPISKFTTNPSHYPTVSVNCFKPRPFIYHQWSLCEWKQFWHIYLSGKWQHKLIDHNSMPKNQRKLIGGKLSFFKFKIVPLLGLKVCRSIWNSKMYAMLFYLGQHILNFYTTHQFKKHTLARRRKNCPLMFHKIGA